MKILSARQYNSNLKVTIQQTGRMNFSDETARVMALAPGMGVKFFMEGDPEELYMAILNEPDVDSFKIKKSGMYFYAATQLLFDALGVDYNRNTVFYDLTRCVAYDEEAGGKCYKMNYRPIKKKAHGKDVE